MPVKSPTLYRLAADRRYGDIPDRVDSHPSDLFWTDRYGSTALHILCQARTVDPDLLKAVDAILENAPELTSWPNVATWTPLHFAVERRLLWGEEEEIAANEASSSFTSPTTALILRLLRACPSAVSLRTRSGYKTKTPFHIACEAAADYRVLKAMLSINPELATEPFVKRDPYANIENPLQLLWKAHLHLAGTRTREIIPPRAERNMALLLKAAFTGSVRRRKGGQQPAFFILHAACSVRTPRDYFSHILSQNLPDVSVKDENDYLPLHHAVRSAISSDSVAYTQYVLEALLKVFPKAAEIPLGPLQRLPLHVAVADSYLTWHKGGLNSLALAHVGALRAVDPESGLLPFLVSAEAAIKSRMHLSTTYELLRIAPEAAQICRSYH